MTGLGNLERRNPSTRRQAEVTISDDRVISPNTFSDSNRSRVLPPYITAGSRFWRIVGYGALASAALGCGLVWAFFAPSFAVAFILPIFALSATVVWALPDLRHPPGGLLDRLLFALLVVLIAWPNYLAIAIPGFPWITLTRLVSLPLVGVLLFHTSTSKLFRATMSNNLRAQPIVALLLIFVALQFFSIFLSKDIFHSVENFATAQFTWTGVFFAAVFVFSRPGRIELYAKILWALVVFVGTLAIVEYRMRHLPWAGHIPSLLRIQDESVVRAIEGSMRAGTDQYRAHSTFSTSLGLSEFNALALPFILNFAVEKTYPTWQRLLAAGTVPFLLYVTILSGSRLGMIGACVTFLLFTVIWAVRRWRRLRSDIIGPALVLSYPAVFCAFLAATVFVGRIRRIVWGGGETAASTDGRRIQYAMGIPKILSHPFGYGIGQGATTLGFFEPGGLLTIDTYYLAVALEYGVLGFFIYYGMFFYAIGQSAKHVISSSFREQDAGLLVPACISLASFVVVKSVFAQQDNHPLVFMILAIVVVLARKSQAARQTTVGCSVPM